jgi:hypothetical protein
MSDMESDEEFEDLNNSGDESVYKSDSDSGSDDSFLGTDPDSDEESSDENVVDSVFKRFLISWTIKNCVPRTHLNELLRGIKDYIEAPYHIEFGLPRDYRSLLKTPRNLQNVITPAGTFGKFAYIKIKDGLTRAVKQGLDLRGSRNVKIDTFLDGFTAHHNRRKKFWTILHSVRGDGFRRVFLSGLYVGSANPSPYNDILRPFVEEFNQLKNEPFDIPGVPHKLTLVVGGVMAMDMPAKADAKCTKPSGYCACDFCTQRGKACPTTVVFPELTFDKRTNESFRNREQLEHHKGDSILEDIEDLNMVRDFPHDYLHLVLLGVVKRLNKIYLFLNTTARLSRANILIANEKFAELTDSIPSEFMWKPRDLDQWHHFKGKENRYFLLYAGIIVFKNVLPDEDYEQFVGLSLAIRILSSPQFEYNEEWLARAEKLIYNFVYYVKHSLGERHLVRVVHGLLHLTDDCRRFGCLDSFSCFPYESYISHIKRMMKSPNLPLVQVVRRYMETEFGDIFETPKNLKTMHGTTSRPHAHGPTLRQCSEQFKSIVLDEFIISCNAPDNTIMLTSGLVIVVKNIVTIDEKQFFVGQKYNIIEDYFSNPLPSSSLNIVSVRELSVHLEEYDTNLLHKKCCSFSSDGAIVVLPLIH